MTLTFDRFFLIAQGTVLLLQAVLSGLFWVAKRSFVTRTDIAPVLDRVAALEQGAALARQRLHDLPGHDDLKDLNASVAAVDRKLGTLTGRVDGITNNVALVLETLLEGKR